jgi:hypothetical protein
MLSSSSGSVAEILSGSTAYPTTDWVARQNTEAFLWNEAPRYMIRDRDCFYGAVVVRRLRAMRHPGRVDHIIVLGEVNLRRILKT